MIISIDGNTLTLNTPAQTIRGTARDARGRRIDVTDDNQVIVKIVDGQTQKVVRQIPKADEVALKQAIQENLDNLTDSEGGESVDVNT